MAKYKATYSLMEIDESGTSPNKHNYFFEAADDKEAIRVSMEYIGVMKENLFGGPLVSEDAPVNLESLVELREVKLD